GSVVVVKEYEVAVFMRDGKVYDVLPPGRHVITTQNIPLLTRAYNPSNGIWRNTIQSKHSLHLTKTIQREIWIINKSQARSKNTIHDRATSIWRILV
ncbi:MAG: SPFH domain-containing protein, partial [Desulfurococcaceae archaeon]